MLSIVCGLSLLSLFFAFSSFNTRHTPSICGSVLTYQYFLIKEMIGCTASVSISQHNTLKQHHRLWSLSLSPLSLSSFFSVFSSFPLSPYLSLFSFSPFPSLPIYLSLFSFAFSIFFFFLFLPVTSLSFFLVCLLRLPSVPFSFNSFLLSHRLLIGQSFQFR